MNVLRSVVFAELELAAHAVAVSMAVMAMERILQIIAFLVTRQVSYSVPTCGQVIGFVANFCHFISKIGESRATLS
jgi:hypothetical protein